MTSRPYSMMRLCMARMDPDYKGQASVELDLSKRLMERTQRLGWAGETAGAQLIPFSTAHMPTNDVKTEDGTIKPGYEVELVKECSDLMNGSDAYDPGEVQFIAKGIGNTIIAKDLSANLDATGGVLVGLPSQGQLIDLLRPLEIFSQAGAQDLTLPPQGSIRFPRDTSDPTIAAFAEGATITESTPATGELLLSAKKYAGLVDIPVELMKFATSTSVEAWLRRKFVARIAVQTDADMVNGAGGTAMKGVITYSGFVTRIASTTGANGDTLVAEDPMLLLGEIGENNARIENSFFFALRHQLYAGLITRRASVLSGADALGAFVYQQAFLNQAGSSQIYGHKKIVSTNIPADRVKGSGTNLTLLLAGVGSSWIIARSGVVEIDMTTSDASKFASGINTMRGLVFMDAGPEHEDEFGMIDDLLNS